MSTLTKILIVVNLPIYYLIYIFKQKMTRHCLGCDVLVLVVIHTRTISMRTELVDVHDSLNVSPVNNSDSDTAE